MTENTVPRVARFADLRVGMTIERVCAYPSGTTTTYAGVVSKVAERAARDDADLVLAASRDDDNHLITLRVLADPTPKPVPNWGVLVRAVGGKHDGKRAFTTHNEQLQRTRWVVEGSYVPVRGDEITDWEVIYDPNAPTADPLDESDHRDRIDGDGFRITRHGNKHWHTKTTTCYGHCEDNSLANWNAACGPLRFADEVTA